MFLTWIRAARVTIAVALMAPFLGCSATMVEKPGGTSSSPYAPVNEASRGGVVKYLNEGAKSIRNKRREDAYKKMYEACRGPYRIVAEGPQAEGGVVIQISPTSSVYSSSQYWYIQFSCGAGTEP
jgi:hypothetical protein